MTTTMKQLRFGIEIETVGLGRRELADAIRSVVGGEVGYEDVVAADGRRWRVVPDGSLSGGERSGEIVSPILGYDDIATLQEVVRAVRRAGARADQSCGIHYAQAVVMRSQGARPASSWASLMRHCT